MTIMTALGIHTPKVAGTSILHAIRTSLPLWNIYQNTSFTWNFQHNQCEFLELNHLSQLRFVWGHHIHEEMVRLLTTPMITFTGLRDPLARVRSEIRFNIELTRDRNLDTFSPERFIETLDNPNCRFFIERFPSLIEDGEAPWEQAASIVSHFDIVYFPDTIEWCMQAVWRALGLPTPSISNENVSNVDLPSEVEAMFKGDKSVEKKIEQDILFYNAVRNARFSEDPFSKIETAGQDVLRCLPDSSNIDRLRTFLNRKLNEEFTYMGTKGKIIKSFEKREHEARSILATLQSQD